MNQNTKTIFCDIDGTIFRQVKFNKLDENEFELLPGVLERFNKWYENGFIIILVTGRLESSRNLTINQLNNANIKYHQLIMGIGRENRYLINNNTLLEPNNPRAFAINLIRDSGFFDLNFDKFDI
jgi:hypothetical protein